MSMIKTPIATSAKTPSVGPYFLGRPTNPEIKDIEATIPKRPFNFPHVTITKNGPPLEKSIKSEGWSQNEARVKIGTGRQAYDRGVAALKDWQHFDFDWAFVANKPAIKKDTPTVVTAQSLFLWSSNPLRITFVDNGRTANGGQKFQYGTTTVEGHQLAGEEKFSLEWNKSDDSVYYEIYSVSRPASPLVWMAQPLLKFYQHKFTTDSVNRMKKIVAGKT